MRHSCVFRKSQPEKEDKRLCPVSLMELKEETVWVQRSNSDYPHLYMYMYMVQCSSIVCVCVVKGEATVVKLCNLQFF
jgi:hypothetical protein